MKLTSQMIKEKAKELGIDAIAIGNIVMRFRFFLAFCADEDGFFWRKTIWI